MKRLLVALLVLVTTVAWATAARAAPVRILVAVGASGGLGADRPLAHTQDDAAGVRDVLTSLGGVTRDATIFVPDATKDALLGALERARIIAARHTPNEVTLIVYFSGHGDRDALHIRGERLPTTELSARLAAIPAALRIVVIDACRTTDPARSKGMEVTPGFAVSLTGQPTMTGMAWLFASADGEAAQESDEIGGAIFTHFWLAGLRGAADTNADQRVTLDEAFAYAYSQTLLRSARSGGVLQRPQEKLEVVESSPFVLTELAGERAQLELPREGDGLYLVYAVGSQSVVAEVYGVADRAVRIVLPKGKYIVQKRIGTRGEAVELTLSAGATRVLASSDFRPFAAERLAQKGELVVRPWSLSVVDGLLTGTHTDVSDELALRLERRETWGWSVGPFVGIGTLKTVANDVTEISAGAEASGDRFFTLGAPVLLRLGVDARVEGIAQTVRRNDADRALLAGFSASAHHAGMAAGGGLHAGLRVSLPASLYLALDVRVLALGVKTSSGIEGRLLGGGGVGLGVTF